MDFDPDHPERNGNGGVFTAEHRPCHCEGCDLCEKRTFKIVGNLIRNVECRFACEDCHEDDPANDPASNGDFCRYCTYCVEILTPTRERRIGLQCEFECQDCSDSEECWYLERGHQAENAAKYIEKELQELHDLVRENAEEGKVQAHKGGAPYWKLAAELETTKKQAEAMWRERDAFSALASLRLKEKVAEMLKQVEVD